jgi:hypothetical protein
MVSKNLDTIAFFEKNFFGIFELNTILNFGKKSKNRTQIRSGAEQSWLSGFRREP